MVEVGHLIKMRVTNDISATRRDFFTPASLPFGRACPIRSADYFDYPPEADVCSREAISC